MKRNSLTNFIESMRQVWGPLNSNLVMRSQAIMQDLAKAPISEPWLADLQGDLPDGRELYRDPEHGFMLLAHTENKGLYRAPHDHGNGWVIYSVHRGEMEMGTYRRIQTETGKFNLVHRESYRVMKGQTRVYLPEDVHDTKCISDSVLMLRLTSCDLKMEMKAGRMHRYAEEK